MAIVEAPTVGRRTFCFEKSYLGCWANDYLVLGLLDPWGNYQGTTGSNRGLEIRKSVSVLEIVRSWRSEHSPPPRYHSCFVDQPYLRSRRQKLIEPGATGSHTQSTPKDQMRLKLRVGRSLFGGACKVGGGIGLHKSKQDDGPLNPKMAHC